MKQQSIEKAPIQYFPLDQLYLSPMNPREGVDAEGIALLAESRPKTGRDGQRPPTNQKPEGGENNERMA